MTTPFSYAFLEKDLTALVSHLAHVNTMCSLGGGGGSAEGVDDDLVQSGRHVFGDGGGLWSRSA